MPASTPAGRAGTINEIGNVDVYNFTPAAGQTHLYFNVQSESGSGCVNANVTQGSTTVVGNWPLYHAIINNCTQFPNPSGNDRGPIAVTPGLTYTLTVSGSGETTGNYRIQILNAPVDTFNVEIGQTISPGVPASTPAGRAGTINEIGNVDLYTFTGTAGERLIFDVKDEPGHGCLNATVTGPGGTTLVPAWIPYFNGITSCGANPSDRGTPDAPIVLPSTGTYTVRVSGVGDAVGNFRIQITTPGHARPQVAAAVHLSLVPAFATCTSPNRNHGPPDLPGGQNPDRSCAPPVRQSSVLTVGAPDANGKPLNSEGAFVMKATANDVTFDVRITDVRNAGNLTDYTGDLRVDLNVRITDKMNGPSAENHSATLPDMSVGFPITLDCVPTSGTSDIGSTCSATTTANAINPGAVQGGFRTVWQLGQVEVSDGGADGNPNTTPNTVFARQGVFVP